MLVPAEADEALYAVMVGVVLGGVVGSRLAVLSNRFGEFALMITTT